jgi:hypothetical protein
LTRSSQHRAARRSSSVRASMLPSCRECFFLRDVVHQHVCTGASHVHFTKMPTLWQGAQYG